LHQRLSYKSFYKRVLGEKIVEKKEGTKVSYRKNEEGYYKLISKPIWSAKNG
jgi:hypothetical protein